MKIGLNFVPGFLESEECKPLSWPIDDRDEDDPVITGDDCALHCEVVSASKEQLEAFSDLIFHT